jgi:hypothetical protein
LFIYLYYYHDDYEKAMRMGRKSGLEKKAIPSPTLAFFPLVKMSSSSSSDLALRPPEPKVLATAAEAIVLVLLLGLALAASLYAASFSPAGGGERRPKIRGWPKASSRTATTTTTDAPTQPAVAPTGKRAMACIVLDLPPDATPSQIRKRYHQLARDHHPDKHPENRPSAHRQLVRYNSAYQALVEGRPVAADVAGVHTPTPHKPWPGPRPPVPPPRHLQHASWTAAPDLLLELLVQTVVVFLVVHSCVVLVRSVWGRARNAFRHVRRWRQNDVTPARGLVENEHRSRP